MPSVPTSLLLVLLVAAWLWVLVPMFARSREAVPESDDTAAGFRILRRAGRVRRSRAGAARTTGEVETVQDNTIDAQQPRERDDADERWAEADAADADQWDGYSDDADAADAVDDAAADDADAAAGAGRSAAAGAAGADPDEAPTQQLPRLRDADADPDAADPADRPVRRHKPGRGGFDPEHAAATARYKYRRRRLITLVLAAVTAVLLLGAVVVNGSLWIGVVAGVLSLAGYLGYLSRTVRIEREISERRMARLRRARELRPYEVQQAQPQSPYQRRADQQGAARRLAAEAALAAPAVPVAGAADQPAASQVPPHGRTVVRRGASDGAADAVTAGAVETGVAARTEPGRYTVVDLDDDDPAFDDLDMYEPVVYRRAAGQ
ncbi:gephyrin-like molybdotransferase receptor GlpR [Nakamurella aerolata]|uniref:DUF4231 domain-containing protein n=1 Tax=Nakamurella aerolata TaxID=1656892 RepID=A0A849AEM3_9ACTN|nr:gephyrin-like molybdotransferase receptor GlpR [Nakamurella aerolata]NNG35302.1 DUF4231 domain-containing protein [Nakamurella aerolata]